MQIFKNKLLLVAIVFDALIVQETKTGLQKHLPRVKKLFFLKHVVSKMVDLLVLSELTLL